MENNLSAPSLKPQTVDTLMSNIVLDNDTMWVLFFQGTSHVAKSEMEHMTP